MPRLMVMSGLIPAEHAHRYVMQSAWIMHAVHCGMQPLSKVVLVRWVSSLCVAAALQVIEARNLSFPGNNVGPFGAVDTYAAVFLETEAGVITAADALRAQAPESAQVAARPVIPGRHAVTLCDLRSLMPPQAVFQHHHWPGEQSPSERMCCFAVCPSAPSACA